jgi:hypothetical protein
MNENITAGATVQITRGRDKGMVVKVHSIVGDRFILAFNGQPHQSNGIVTAKAIKLV